MCNVSITGNSGVRNLKRCRHYTATYSLCVYVWCFWGRPENAQVMCIVIDNVHYQLHTLYQYDVVSIRSDYDGMPTRNVLSVVYYRMYV